MNKNNSLKELEEIEKKILKEGEKICKDFSIDSKLLMFLKNGKKLRSKLLILSGNIKNKKKRIDICTLIELLHVASLVHDDIIDENSLRRGAPTINSLINEKYAVSVGYAFFSHIFMELLTKDEQILLSFFETMKEMCIGEILEIKSTFNKSRNIENYIKVISLKTGSLFALSCSINEKNNNENLKSFGKNFGIAFQILDDISDITEDENKLGKETFKDLRGGIYTLPVIYYLSNRDEVNKLFSEESINKSKIKAIKYLLMAKKNTKNKKLLDELEILEKNINDVSLNNNIHFSQKTSE
ncbi:MAG TPA: polyprenyl synthetase family protein [Caldisericia bacterium]|nr:polyprenyl synthetase family protein [Caldisericia bacterium]